MRGPPPNHHKMARADFKSTKVEATPLASILPTPVGSDGTHYPHRFRTR